MRRRELLRMAGVGAMGAVHPAGRAVAAQGVGGAAGWVNVRAHGAAGDGVSTDSPAINRAIAAAAGAGGGTVYFPAGIYLSYSIHLRSKVGLYLDQGAVILGGPTPLEGTATGGYDAAEPQGAEFEAYQDYGHNHWHNSLLWGEGIEDVSITGPGLIWGKGLSRGWERARDPERPDARKPGVGNKALALKNCRNVLLRDFKILEGGWFGILATGIDNLTIDNLLIDTIRDGIDIDCCRNVRISNCTVNSPYDDGICPKSSFALGYARATENVTIANCYVTGGYEVGTVLDGTWKRLAEPAAPTGRIKLGTESNGGFKNVAITNCVFESCKGLALETMDGAVVEDISFCNVTMRDLRSAPWFLRIGTRMRGPAGVGVGTMRRVVLSNIVCQNASGFPAILAGVPGHAIEDVKISDVFVEQAGGGSASLAAQVPEERERAYPDPEMFGELPATGLFARHVRNLEVTNFEIAVRAADARPAFWLDDVDGADFFRVRVPAAARAFDLRDVRDFRSFGSARLEDVRGASIERRVI